MNLYKEYIKSNQENLLKYAFAKGHSIEYGGETKPLLTDSYSLHESLLSVSIFTSTVLDSNSS